MSNWIDDNDGVYVAGIGMHAYQFPSETPYTHLGLTAVRAALADAGLAWPQVNSAYVGTTSIGMAAGRVMLRHLGSSGLAVTQVENASASGSFAFRQASIISCAFATLTSIGFSQRTCFPARAARMVNSPCIEFGRTT